jgi:hypothetical protein
MKKGGWRVEVDGKSWIERDGESWKERDGWREMEGKSLR